MFVTRAVRIIDLITNNNMQVFKKRGGIHFFIDRLSLEVDHCRVEEPFCLVPANKEFVQDEDEKKSSVVKKMENEMEVDETATSTPLKPKNKSSASLPSPEKKSNM